MYIFTYNQQDNSFPERYRVVLPEDDAESLRETESLSGTVLKAEAIDFLDEMLVRYRSQEHIITEMVDAPYWEFIEQRFNPAKAADNAKPRII
jgi:hypothetical protein